MADNLITRAFTVNTENVSSVKNSPVSPVEKPEVDKKPKQEAPALENVIYTSEDGDTVQVKPEASERLSDGFVFNKADMPSREETIDIDVTDKADKADKEDNADKAPVREEKENAVKQAEESAAKIEARREERIEEMIKASQAESDKRKEEIKDALRKEAEDKEADKALDNKTSFSGISDTELERMYLTGKISSYDYNSAMASRKEEEAETEREAADTSGRIANADAELDRNKVLEDAISAEQKGSGYSTKEEREAVQQALFGTGKDDNTAGKGFEINIIK